MFVIALLNIIIIIIMGKSMRPLYEVTQFIFNKSFSFKILRKIFASSSSFILFLSRRLIRCR